MLCVLPNAITALSRHQWQYLADGQCENSIFGTCHMQEPSWRAAYLRAFRRIAQHTAGQKNVAGRNDQADDHHCSRPACHLVVTAERMGSFAEKM